MIKRIMLAFLLWIEDLISRWAERREIERTRDAQDRNDDRDRGDAGDVADRMRDRARRERDPRGNLPEADDKRGTDKSG